MSTYEVLPGSMSLAFRRGDRFSTLIDFDGVSLVDCVVSASVVSTVSGEVVKHFMVDVTDAAASKVNISLASGETAVIPVGTYSWRLGWVAPGNAARTALAGTVEVVA
jgi:hypothetical protein